MFYLYILLIILVGFLAPHFEQILTGKDYKKSRFYKKIKIPFSFGWAICTIVLVLMFEYININIFYLSILAAIVLTFLECIGGHINKMIRGQPWSYYILPFCNGYNSILVSIGWWAMSLILFFFLSQIKNH